MAEVQGMDDSKNGKRSCSKSVIGDEASWSGSKKGGTETLQSESDIEIEEEEEVRFFTEEETAQFDEGRKQYWASKKISRYQQKHTECFKHSQGFDLPTDDEDSSSEGDLPMNQVVKCEEADFAAEGDVGQAAIWALREQNKLMNTNLELVQIVKANAALVSGIIYYITLVARDYVTREQNTYQAKVYEPIRGDSKLRIFQPAPPVVDAQGQNDH